MVLWALIITHNRLARGVFELLRYWQQRNVQKSLQENLQRLQDSKKIQFQRCNALNVMRVMFLQSNKFCVHLFNVKIHRWKYSWISLNVLNAQLMSLFIIQKVLSSHHSMFQLQPMLINIDHYIRMFRMFFFPGVAGR